MSIENLILGVNSVIVSYFIYYDSLLQNTTDLITKCDSYFITKCARSLLENATVLLQNATEVHYKMRRFYYKMSQKFITKCDSFITKCDDFITKCVRGLLQNATILLQNATGITKCDSYYKIRRLLQIVTVQ